MLALVDWGWGEGGGGRDQTAAMERDSTNGCFRKAVADAALFVGVSISSKLESRRDGGKGVAQRKRRRPQRNGKYAWGR